MMKLLVTLFAMLYAFRLFKDIKKEIKLFKEFKQKKQGTKPNETQEDYEIENAIKNGSVSLFKKIVKRLKKVRLFRRFRIVKRRNKKTLVNFVIAAFVFSVFLNISGTQKSGKKLPNGNSLKKQSVVAKINNLQQGTSGSTKAEVVSQEETVEIKKGFELVVNGIQAKPEGNVVFAGDIGYVNVDILSGVRIYAEGEQLILNINGNTSYISENNIILEDGKTYISFRNISLDSYMRYERLADDSERLTVVIY